ncbi:LIM domain kinase [Echinococcus granulosus]|uniref:LIM domain kinase n=1 Tax=Echinococcus granulosus TaxID=6210 RepID=W6UVK4_ECHGR|nr:LIM domain kinase [Echinococcus granulosus]EUB64671.1 LIM domain kinase [Echinococcus granulosus]
MPGCVCIGCGQKCLIPFYQLKDGFFHPDCFRCSVCNVDLHNKPYFLLSGKLVCYDDIKAACCRTCQSIIRGDRIITQFGDFHKECFQCSRCGSTSEGESSFAMNAASHSNAAATLGKSKLRMKRKICQAVERHVVTSSRCESAAYGTDDDEKEANSTSDSLKLKQEEQKKESQNVELGASSPPPKPKRLKKPSVCIPNPSTGTNRMPPVAVGLSPKRGSCSPQSPSCSDQELSQAYEKISAQANEHPESGASTADQNSTKLWVEEIEGPKVKSRESQPISKLPLQALSEPISPISPTRFVQEPRTDRGVRWAFASTMRFGGTLLLLILSIVAIPISTLLCFQNWMTKLVPEDPISLRSLGIEIIDDATRPKPSD